MWDDPPIACCVGKFPFVHACNIPTSRPRSTRLISSGDVLLNPQLRPRTIFRRDKALCSIRIVASPEDEDCYWRFQDVGLRGRFHMPPRASGSICRVPTAYSDNSFIAVSEPAQPYAIRIYDTHTLQSSLLQQTTDDAGALVTTLYHPTTSNDVLGMTSFVAENGTSSFVLALKRGNMHQRQGGLISHFLVLWKLDLTGSSLSQSSSRNDGLSTTSVTMPFSVHVCRTKACWPQLRSYAGNIVLVDKLEVRRIFLNSDCLEAQFVAHEDVFSESQESFSVFCQDEDSCRGNSWFCPTVVIPKCRSPRKLASSSQIMTDFPLYVCRLKRDLVCDFRTSSVVHQFQRTDGRPAPSCAYFADDLNCLLVGSERGVSCYDVRMLGKQLVRYKNSPWQKKKLAQIDRVDPNGTTFVAVGGRYLMSFSSDPAESEEEEESQIPAVFRKVPGFDASALFRNGAGGKKMNGFIRLDQSINGVCVLSQDEEVVSSVMASEKLAFCFQSRLNWLKICLSWGRTLEVPLFWADVDVGCIPDDSN